MLPLWLSRTGLGTLPKKPAPGTNVASKVRTRKIQSLANASRLPDQTFVVSRPTSHAGKNKVGGCSFCKKRVKTKTKICLAAVTINRTPPQVKTISTGGSMCDASHPSFPSSSAYEIFCPPAAPAASWWPPPDLEERLYGPRNRRFA